MNKLQISDFLNYKFISQLKVSPNEKYSAFVLAESNYKENNYNKNIYLLNNISKKISQLTTMNKEGSFIWLNNDTILFNSTRDKSVEEDVENGAPWTLYYEINIHGGEAKEFLRIPYDVSSIKVISENKFAILIEHKGSTINLHEYTGEERTKAAQKYKDELDYEIIEEIPFWSNGASFTNKHRDRLAICTKNSNDEMTIDFITDKITTIENYEVENNKILFIATSFENKMDLFNSINEYDIEKAELNELYPQIDMSIESAFYLDGQVVAHASDMKDYGLNQNKNFYIVKNRQMNLLTEHDAGFGSSVGSDVKLGAGLSYKVHGDKVYFINTLQYGSYINSLDIEGHMDILSTNNGSVDMFDIAGDEILFVGLRSFNLQELYTISLGEEIQVSHFNDDYMKNKSISKPEYFQFLNSDRILIDGWIIKPTDYDENKKYPCILDIHGGPKTVYGDVFFHEMQIWANMGYFVIFSNPRGGDGRGNTFMDIRGKYGTVDYDDLMEFTDECLERYTQIDKNRLGVTGGSYGGYMTNWIIGHTNRFKCAASQRSISNWISKFGTTDIGYYFNSDQNDSTPWDNHDKMWWHSPLKYADKCSTPTLFIHSECDYRCWIAEGLQMFTALKYHGVDAKLCMFKGENHNLSRSGKPKHREKRLVEMTNWFEKYLK